MKKVLQVFKELIEKVHRYNPMADLELIQKAYDVAEKFHADQKRVSGEPYISHPVQVAYILADMELDVQTIIAAILHDVVEDTLYTEEQMRKDFGDEIADIVLGVTKLTKLHYTTVAEQQAENLRKMFMAMAKDIRVIVIKLADRLHNMRTLSVMPERKQLEKSRETMEIYAPLAHRLGMSKIKWELEDLSIRYLDPVSYREIAQNIAQKREERENYLEEIKFILAEKLNVMGFEYDMQSRAKHFYSIYRKMYSQNLPIDQIYDLLAIRVIVNNIADCYAVLGAVHELFRPIPGRFKDYIAMPKNNLYQSLHTSLIGPQGRPFEVQIRTWNMHEIAEVGIAAHWKYKEGSSVKTDTDNKFAWIRQLLEDYKNTSDAEEVVTSVKTDLFEDEVFVFSPKGDLIALANGSTGIDFAYSIHSEIGNKTVGVKINGNIKPLNTKLKNGDFVEIITSKTASPSRDWLKIAATNQAKRKINEYFKKERRDENVVRGKNAFERELRRNLLYDITYQNLNKWVPFILKKYTLKEINDLYAMMGYGGLAVLKVISTIKDKCKDEIESKKRKTLEEEEHPIQKKIGKKKNNQEVIVKGIDNCLIRYAKCCNPVYGDDIIGYITRGRGVSVHRGDCTNIINDSAEQKARQIEVEWGENSNANYETNIKVYMHTRPNVIAEIMAKISELKLVISSLEAKNDNNVTIANFVVQIPNKEVLNQLINKIQNIKEVFSVKRSTN